MDSRTTERGRRRALPLGAHLATGWLLVLVLLGMIGFWVPAAVEGMPNPTSYLIFFFHFPSAVNCLNFFAFAGVLSLLHLARRGQGLRHDFWAASAIEVGMLACTVTLVTGSIWARLAWSIWWDFKDPRLMSVAIMWFTYAGYLALRGTIDEPFQRARFCAVFGIIAAINVPLVWFSIRWLGQQHHPMNVTMGETSMVVTRWFGALAFLVLYWAFWRLRYRIHAGRHGLFELEESFARRSI
jgi:heme exporter protein C